MSAAGEDDYEEVDGLPGGVSGEQPVDAFEEVDAVAVLVDAHPIEPRRESRLPVPVQATAVALGGFVTGVLTILLWRRRHGGVALRRASSRGRPRRGVARRGRRPEDRGQVVASRSFLVDVHLLGGRE